MKSPQKKENTMKNQAKIQEKYLELKFLEQKINQVNEQILELEKQSLTFNLLSENLEDIQKTKTGEKIFVPLGSGLFIESQLKDNKEVLINIGSDVFIKKDISEARIFIKEQIGQIESTINIIDKTLQKLVLESQKLQSELKELVYEIQ